MLKEQLKEQNYRKPIGTRIQIFTQLKIRLLRLIRGECPHCHSVDLQEVKNWNLMTCRSCGKTFRYD